jgi:hypothetical protein
MKPALPGLLLALAGCCLFAPVAHEEVTVLAIVPEGGHAQVWCKFGDKSVGKVYAEPEACKGWLGKRVRLVLRFEEGLGSRVVRAELVRE